MSDRRYIRTAMATVSSAGSLTPIIAAASGFAFQIHHIEATEKNGVVNSIKFFNGDSQITPLMVLPTSGTLIIDSSELGFKTTAIGSGLAADLGFAGSIEVTAGYVMIDERTPVSFEQAARFNRDRVITTRLPLP